VSTTAIPDRVTTLPGEAALNATGVALEEHGFRVEVAGDLDAAREAALARIPAGPLVIASAPGRQLASCAWGRLLNHPAGRPQAPGGVP
jgi:hypothetical protein